MIEIKVSKPRFKNYQDENSSDPDRRKSPFRSGKGSFISGSLETGGQKIIFAFNLHTKKDYVEKYSGARNTKDLTMDDNHKNLLLIRAAELAIQEGNVRSSSPNPTAAEQLGITINILRRQKQRSISWLSRATDYPPEQLIAFEAGVLSNRKMMKMLPDIAQALQLNSPENNKIQAFLAAAT
jgi:hypothetical protein